MPDEKGWVKKLLKIHKTLAFMEQTKYLEPHYSYKFDDLVALYKKSYVNCVWYDLTLLHRY